MERWNEICYLVNESKKKNLSEKEFQNEIVHIFEKVLGWSRFKNEIEEQRKVDIGSASSLKLDIIIKNESNDLFVVELKKPDAQYIERNDTQLSSYMRQLRLNVGLLINDKIRIFYEDDNCNNPIEIMAIEFVEDTEYGSKFVALFSKQNYNHENLLNFCKYQVESIDAIDYIISNDFENKVFDFIKKEVANIYSSEISDAVLKHINLSISNAEDNTIQVEGIKEDELKSEVIDKEIEKVTKRIPRWLNKPNQINSTILIKAMKYLSKEDSINFSIIEKECEGIDKFMGNFNQMANFGERNHGKVFDKNGDIITLWEPIKEFVRKQYAEYERKNK